MKPPPFAYVRPRSLIEAIEQLGATGGDGKLLAGGQSLIPLLNLRMATPSVLVDIGRLTELQGIQISNGSIVVGAGTTQRELEVSVEAERVAPLLRKALRRVGHWQIRNRGTVGGNLAHADPASELPAVAVALDAILTAVGPTGTRSIPAAEFFQGPFTTALEPNEILTEIAFPAPTGARTAFVEFSRRAGDFAIAGVAAAIVRDPDGRVIDARLAACGVGATPTRLARAEAALVGNAPSDQALQQASAAAAAEVEPFSDGHGGPDFRRRVLATLLTRAVQEACA